MRTFARVFFLLLICWVGSSNLALSQKKEGDKYFEKDQFAEALKFYNQYPKIAKREETLIRRAICHYHLGNASKCLFDLNLAERLGNQSEELFKYRALTLHSLSKYQDAAEIYKRQLKFYKNDSPERQDLVDRIKQCGYARNFILKPAIGVANNLGNQINTVWNEERLVESVNFPSKIYFTSDRPISKEELLVNDSKEEEPFLKTQDIYTSTYNQSIWSSVEIFDLLINSDKNEKLLDFSNNGQVVFFQSGSTTKDLWLLTNTISEENNEIRPSRFHSPISLVKGDRDLRVVNDSILIFASKELQGYGGYDLYYVTRNSSGVWSAPINFGEKINTSSDELSPFLSRNAKKLYFSSDRVYGLGGYDIFSSDYDGFEWSYPSNMGAGVNSTMDEFDFVLSRLGNKAFLSSNRLEGNGGFDLYQLDFIEQEINNLSTIVDLSFFEFSEDLGTMATTDVNRNKNDLQKTTKEEDLGEIIDLEQAAKKALEREIAEKEAVAKQAAIKEQLAKEQALRQQIAAEKQARELAEKQAATREAAMQEQLKKERLEKEQAASDLAAKEALEKELALKEQIAQEKLARERAEQEAAEREKEIKKQLALEQAAKEKAAKELAIKEQAEKEAAENERKLKEQLVEEKEAREKIEREAAIREENMRQQLAREKAEKEKIEKELAVKEAAVKKEKELRQLALEEEEKKRKEEEQAAKEKAAREAVAKEKALREQSAKALAAEEKRKEEEAARIEVAKEYAAKVFAANQKSAEEKAEKERIEKEKEAKKQAAIDKSPPIATKPLVYDDPEFQVNLDMDAVTIPTKEIIVEPLYFNADEYLFSNHNQVILNRIVSAMEYDPELKVVVISHGLKEGQNAFDLFFSAKRGEVIIEQFKTMGIKEKNLKLIGVGSNYPLVKQMSQGKKVSLADKYNRRLDIIVYPSKNSKLSAFHKEPIVADYLRDYKYDTYMDASNGLSYRINVKETNSLLENTPLNKYDDLIIEKVGKKYRYTLGLFKNFKDCKKLFDALEKEGFKDMQILPYENNLLISKDRLPLRIETYNDLINFINYRLGK